jgi:hypothetical protein
MSLVEDLKKKTMPQLKAYAKKENIDLFGTSTKEEVLETILNWIPIEEFPGKENIKEEKKKPKSDKTTAIYTTRNLFWSGVGELNIGYNIVNEEDAQKWLTHKAVRIATPDEVAKHYGKK